MVSARAPAHPPLPPAAPPLHGLAPCRLPIKLQFRSETLLRQQYREVGRVTEPGLLPSLGRRLRLKGAREAERAPLVGAAPQEVAPQLCLGGVVPVGGEARQPVGVSAVRSQSTSVLLVEQIRGCMLRQPEPRGYNKAAIVLSSVHAHWGTAVASTHKYNRNPLLLTSGPGSAAGSTASRSTRGPAPEHPGGKVQGVGVAWRQH